MKEDLTEEQEERIFTILEKADGIKDNLEKDANQIIYSMVRKKWSNDAKSLLIRRLVKKAFSKKSKVFIEPIPYPVQDENYT